MAENTIPKNAIEWITYISLVSTASRPDLQANPTIAAGDFQVSTDGSAFTNLDSIPVVTPASGVMVKLTLSIAEMTGDNVTVKCIDAAGGEWDDLMLSVHPATRKMEDLAFPTTTGRSLDVSAGGEAGVDWANVGSPTTAVDLSGTDIQLCDTVTTNTDVRGTDSAALASVCTEGRLAELDAANLPSTTDDTLTDTAELGAAVGVSLSADIAAVKNDTALTLVDTADMQPKLGTPATDVSADIAAVKGDTAATLTDTGTTIPGTITTLQSDTDDIQTRLPAALTGAGLMSSDMTAISTSTDAADKLEASAEVLITGVAEGVPTTTTMPTDLTDADDNFNGRLLTWTSGALSGQQTDITNYANTNGVLTFTAVTVGATAGDSFVIQ